MLQAEIAGVEKWPAPRQAQRDCARLDYAFFSGAKPQVQRLITSSDLGVVRRGAVTPKLPSRPTDTPMRALPWLGHLGSV